MLHVNPLLPSLPLILVDAVGPDYPATETCKEAVYILLPLTPPNSVGKRRQ